MEQSRTNRRWMSYQMTKTPRVDLTEAEKHALYKSVGPAVGGGFTFGNESIQTEVYENSLDVKYHSDLEYINRKIQDTCDLALVRMHREAQEYLNEKVRELKRMESNANKRVKRLEAKINEKIDECMRKMETFYGDFTKYAEGTQRVHEEFQKLKEDFELIKGNMYKNE